jgi:hypothetical protein
MALPFGRLRMKGQGSAGGHNGLRSIIGEMGTESFARLRVGIGAPSGGAVQHVLGDFEHAEQQHLDLIIDAAADAVELWATEGADVVANRWNGWRPDLGTEAAVSAGRQPPAMPGKQPVSGQQTTPQRTEPDAAGVVRSSTGWRKLLPRRLQGREPDKPE